MKWSATAVLACCAGFALGSASGQPRPPDVSQRRFPATPDAPSSDEGGQAAPAGHVEATACNELRPEERLSCPLRCDTVVENRPIERGVLLTMRRKSMAVARLRQVLLCQDALYRARPSIGPACPFLADGALFDVRRRRGRVTVAVTVADGPIGVGVLRERIETALADGAGQAAPMAP